MYLGTAGNTFSKWESIEKRAGHNCPSKRALPCRARPAAAQLVEEPPKALSSGSLLLGGHDVQRLSVTGGAGPGLFHVHDQGCHVVRMLDAKGDDRGAGLGHCHLGEERL